MDVKHVEGTDKGKVVLYALSTCVWCRKTKNLLEELGVAYDYAYVDLLPRQEQQAAIGEVKKYNPECNFPTLVLNGSDVIVGFKEAALREKLA